MTREHAFASGVFRALITVTFRPSDRLSLLLVAARSPPRPIGAPLSVPHRPDPQRGAVLAPVQHMRASNRRISIRVATLSEAGQFSLVRGIRPSFARNRISSLFLVHSTAQARVSRDGKQKKNVTMPATA